LCNLSPGGGFDDKGVRLGGFVGARFGRGFADLAVQYSRRDYDYRRNICDIETPSATEPIVRDPNSSTGFSSGGVEVDDIYAGTISGQTRLTEWGVSARMGYDFGGERFLWGPRVSITYLKSEIDAFTESGRTSVTNTVESNNPDILTTMRAAGDPTGLELAFDEQERISLQAEARLVVACRFEPKFGAIIPRVSASWIHEFKGERDLVTVRMAQDLRPTPTRFSFTTNSVDKNKGVVAIGLTAFIGA
jgi:outer membrane autotransporter protein